jgi:hypothetical protein
MYFMKPIIFFIFCLCYCQNARADLRYEPIDFKINTAKSSYFEGEKITFLITITNTDKDHSYPVLLPHTQNHGEKLFYLNLYDKANNASVLRATENKNLDMMVHDSGSVQIRYLKPREQIVISIYLNDFDNYLNYHTQNSSHHSFGVPLFAGVYKVNMCYNPKGTVLGDSIYQYYQDFEEQEPNGKLQMPSLGIDSRTVELKIKRSAHHSVKIEGIPYFISFDGHRYSYYRDSIGSGGSTKNLAHVTNLPPDSCSLGNEYFYSHFPNNYGEYILRFEDGDIKEYHKYRDICPVYLYTLKFNDFKEKTLLAMQLADGRFYSVSYNQPSNTKHEETFCSADGTLCNVNRYTYNNVSGLVTKETTQSSPCLMIEQDLKEKKPFD